VWQGVLRLASGEIPARLFGIVVLLLLARTSGVVIVGVYALTQSMVQYTYPFIDFGLRHVGARLIARYPEAGDHIVRRVQKRRTLMAFTALPFLLGYTALANLPTQYKVFVFVFAAISCLYAASLEWAAWGREHLRLVGSAKMIIPGCLLVFVLPGIWSGHVLSWLVVGNFVGFLATGVLFWAWWRRHRPSSAQDLPLATIHDSLAWSRTSIMGIAWFCNLAFNTVDMLMLGVMSNPHEVGLYSAAYRLMNQVLFTYYLLLQVVYPRLARQDREQRIRALKPAILMALAGAGLVIAALLAGLRQPLITIIFGEKFLAATVLLAILAWAIPLDFLTSYLSNAYIAWSMEKRVLVCTAIAAGSNVVLNFIWIPTYGARAAAINTLASYVIFLAALAVAGWHAAELGRRQAPSLATVANGMHE
jgi:O-antigen/teichoic acid export membrane protein